MGGTIHVKSEINQQTTFTISLEFKTISKNDLDTKKEIPIELLRNKTILIVDDLEDNRNIMKEILVSSKMGLNILEATNGKLAIESVQRQHPDIILMDLDMPEMNGFEATQHLRKKYPDSKIKIIITTASLLTTSVDELIEMGFNGILHKPIKPELLFETLCELIETEN
jgi:two-component system CheB/CheR fusion protein